MRHAWDARALAPLRRRLAAGDPGWDVVHTHGMRANLPVRLLLPSLQRRPLLFTTVHSDLALDYSSALKARGYGLLDRATRAAVDGFCCVSAPLARTLVARGIPAARVHVVHAGLELDRIGLPAGAPLPGRATEPSTPTAPVIGTVARLVPVKDLGLLLDAVALVGREVPHARLVIVGDGPEGAALQRRAAEDDLEGRVEFLGRVAPAWPALTGVQVFALSSRSEGLPISVLEAMALALPVVATAVGGLPEVVQDGATGFLVKRTKDRAADAAALAGRLSGLLKDADLRRRMGEAGKKRVTEQFSSQVAGKNHAVHIRERTGALKEARGPRMSRRPG